MDVGQLLAMRKPVEGLLRQHFRALRKEARRLHPDLPLFVDAVEEFTLRGGKRFRACLLLAGYHLAGGRELRKALPAAAALEAFQSWMLIHDDIMDHGETRRGGPTLHVSLAKLHGSRRLSGSDADFGEAMAITLGDLLEPSTMDLFLSCRCPDGRVRSLLEEYRKMTRATAFGQVLDVLNGVRPVQKVREQDVLTVHRLKSAVYTVSSPLRMGAILGGASTSTLRMLQVVGDDLGVAFQLRDDILGAREVPGEEAEKSANDLYEGKRTLLVVHGWAHAGRDGREALSKVLGNALASPESFDEALTVLEEAGSFDYSEKRIRELVAKAERGIASSSLSTEGKDLLRGIGTVLTERKK
ncbi:MAG: polyprenyl synthetase family protein [Euryarchaeota archaeon]|nr:polyprenyl synthetase family protein [Euryarchaeota archaeon]MDE1836310.1 polyprenyl synthetase family protein [Euryarchaeota archaeon]MDE1879108.1 polyprenyl synthetase family protein [Euryarchaeota archaeon]MDE2044294.1 polyprenyl synthetase family protein [Thermoplasmata archaeon]